MTEKEKDNIKGFTFRIDESIIEEVDSIAEELTKETGFKIDRSNLVRKVLVDYIKTYREGKAS